MLLYFVGHYTLFILKVNTVLAVTLGIDNSTSSNTDKKYIYIEPVNLDRQDSFAWDSPKLSEKP